jgi:hypothetical protein
MQATTREVFSTRGEHNGNHRLTVEQVLAIYNSTESRSNTARLYDCSPMTVTYIRSGKRWGWLTGAAA